MGVIRATTGPTRYLEAAARIRRTEGLRGLASRVLHKALKPIVDWGAITFFERGLAEVAPAGRLGTGVIVREIAPGDLDGLDTGLDPDQHRPDLVDRFANGDRLFAATDAHGECAHTRWLTTSRAYIPEIDRCIAQIGRAHV